MEQQQPYFKVLVTVLVSVPADCEMDAEDKAWRLLDWRSHFSSVPWTVEKAKVKEAE